MFYYLEGTITHMEPYLAVLDCGGAGFAVHTTATTLSALKQGERARLYTYLHVREDMLDLYGFKTVSERNSFRMLIGVSGVGPRAALSILSAGSPEALATAVVTGNEKALTVAPGIGKKIAQRVILELKDKLAKGQLSGEAFSGEGFGAPGDKAGEAAAALAVLGYSKEEIAKVMVRMDVGNLTTEEIVRQALKRLSVQ